VQRSNGRLEVFVPIGVDVGIFDNIATSSAWTPPPVARRGPPKPEPEPDPEEEEEQERQGEWAEVLLYDLVSDVCPLFYLPSHHDFTRLVDGQSRWPVLRETIVTQTNTVILIGTGIKYTTRKLHRKTSFT
jgi:hypothetical protein